MDSLLRIKTDNHYMQRFAKINWRGLELAELLKIYWKNSPLALDAVFLVHKLR